MRPLRQLLYLFCAALLWAAVVPGAGADTWNKKTVVTFDDSVEIPGQVLAPGTYVFKLQDSNSNRNIVQVWNQGETHLLATILAIPNYQLEPSEKTILSYQERPGYAPQALRGAPAVLPRRQLRAGICLSPKPSCGDRDSVEYNRPGDAKRRRLTGNQHSSSDHRP